MGISLNEVFIPSSYARERVTLFIQLKRNSENRISLVNENNHIVHVSLLYTSALQY